METISIKKYALEKALQYDQSQDTSTIFRSSQVENENKKGRKCASIEEIIEIAIKVEAYILSEAATKMQLQ